jgi:HK97 family phage major capsid protein
MSRLEAETLMGYPVALNNDLASPAANAKTITFGNHSRYMIRDVLDILIFRMTDSAYAKKGQVGFLAMLRSGGNLIDTAAVKVLVHSAT